MITLYQFPAAFAVPNLSAYGLKLKTFLRLSRPRFEAKTLNDPRKGGKGKLPFIARVACCERLRASCWA